MKKISLITFCFLFTLISSATLSPPDTLQVISHHKTNIITDPSRGFNEFPGWAVFPSSTASIRKITLLWPMNVLTACIAGMGLYWPYLSWQGGRIGIICTAPGDRPSDLSLRLAFWPGVELYLEGGCDGLQPAAKGLHGNSFQPYRLRKQYGSRLDGHLPLWGDHRPARKRAAGYGYPVAGILSLWWLLRFHRKLPFPRTIICGKDVTTAILRILQTGHGMDDLENCAEFCNKFREVILTATWKITGRSGRNAALTLFIHRRGLDLRPGKLVPRIHGTIPPDRTSCETGYFPYTGRQYAALRKSRQTICILFIQFIGLLLCCSMG